MCLENALISKWCIGTGLPTHCLFWLVFFVYLFLFAKHCAENAQSEMHFKNSNMEAVADCKERPLV